MFEIKITQDQITNFFKGFSKEYGFDFSLKYPEKAVLPLEEFCEFYFKSNELPKSFKKRMDRAYNDAISYGLSELVKKGNILQDADEFIDANKSIIEEYLNKVIFAKKLSKTYITSGKTATELLDDYNKNHI